MPRVYGNSPGQPISFQSCSATENGVAIGLVSMPLMVVKSLFHGAFFVASRRHGGSCFRTAAIVSRAKSGSCSASVGSATGAAGANFSRSRSLIGSSYNTLARSIPASEARPSLLQKRGQPFLRLAGREEEREGRALERVAAAARKELGGDVERELAARAEIEGPIGDRARVEIGRAHV